MMAFESGRYSFGKLTLDIPGLSGFSADGVSVASVAIAATDLRLLNSAAALSGCTGSGAFACRAGQLDLNADTIAFGSGGIRTFGFGGGVAFGAAEGLTFCGRRTRAGVGQRWSVRV